MKLNNVYKIFRTLGWQHLLVLILVAAGLGSILATGGGGGGDGTVVTTTSSSSSGSTPTAASFTLSTSTSTISTDNSDSATISALVLDSSNAPVSGVAVTFSTDNGQLSAASATSASTGLASITLSSGTASKANQTATVTVTVSGIAVSQQVPIQITGTTINIATTSNTLVVDDPATVADEGTTSTVTTTLLDAGNNAISGAAVTIAASSGNVTLSIASGTTDGNGQLSFTVTPINSGTDTITVSALGTTKTQSFTLGAAASIFRITSPATDPSSLAIGSNLTITVNAPTSANVTFATTIGVWDGGASSATTKAVAAGTVSAVLSSAVAGVATIQVYDSADSSITDTMQVAISAAVANASQISLQASPTVVAPSTGTTSNTVRLTAVVRTVALQPVGNAPVVFNITAGPGGGEFIYPAVSFTNNTGTTTATFTSGSISSGHDGVTASATVVGTAITDTVDLTIGNTPGSVVIGRGTVITNVTNTAYTFPMSVLVADTNGNPIPNTVVSLSAWPIQYSGGSWWDADSDPDSEECYPYLTGTFGNEDTNENVTLEAGEDTNSDGSLTPPNSASGTIPTSVTVDANGVGNFDIVYLKSSGIWIVVRIKASVTVLGTETSSTTTYRLPVEETEAKACDLPNSSYFPTISLNSGATDTYNFPDPSFTATACSVNNANGACAQPGGAGTDWIYTWTDPGTASGTTITDWVTLSDAFYSVLVPINIYVN